LLRQIAALIFIFLCTTVAWVFLGSTLDYRTQHSDEQLKGRVGSTWGTAQEQAPPTAAYVRTELVQRTSTEKGKTVTRQESLKRYGDLPIESSEIKVNLKLDHRQKGLLWYSTYGVDFASDYVYRNDSDLPATVTFCLRFPAQRAVYDGLVLMLDGKKLPM
jgi:hypothetical protein